MSLGKGKFDKLILYKIVYNLLITKFNGAQSILRLTNFIYYKKQDKLRIPKKTIHKKENVNITIWDDMFLTL